jgi:hypothetical protein
MLEASRLNPIASKMHGFGISDHVANITFHSACMNPQPSGIIPDAPSFKANPCEISRDPPEVRFHPSGLSLDTGGIARDP